MLTEGKDQRAEWMSYTQGIFQEVIKVINKQKNTTKSAAKRTFPGVMTNSRSAN